MRARRIKCFCGGAKTMLFKGKRESRPCGLRRTAHPRSDAAPAASPRATTPRTRSTPRRTAHLQSCCPSAEHARDPRKRAMPETYNPAPKTKSLRQNSRAARTIAIKSRPAACTSGGILLQLFARGANSAEGFYFWCWIARFGHSPLAGVAGMLCRRAARLQVRCALGS